jgi:anaerobic magnesium-protoporphyrin IX monomethyl ester cyclase
VRVAVAYPPLASPHGTPCLAQNRQFQWFTEPSAFYPVVPATAATMLSDRGHDVCWLDGIAEGWSFEGFMRRLEAARPEVVFIETKTPVVKMHWKIIERIKSAIDTVVVLMGDHVTALPAESLERSPVDYVLTGGDYDFLAVNLVDHLEGRAPLEPGFWYRAGGETASTGPFRLDHDLAQTPPIDRRLTRCELYSTNNGNYGRTPGTYVMAGRDCWYGRCSFCSWTTLYTRFRTRRPRDVVDEIDEAAATFGIREVMDDTGCFPVGGWLREFAELVIERGLPDRVRIDCNMRFGTLTPADYALMREAGFRFVLFGVESGSQETLDRVDKRLGVRDIVEGCRWASRAGLDPHLTIMFGYPWETEHQADQTLALGRYLLKKGYARTVQATLVIPYPGTPLFEECRKNGWLTTLDWEHYDMREPVMRSPIAPDRLQSYVRAVYSTALDPEFLMRRLASIRSMDDVRFVARAARKVVGHLADFGARRGRL